MEQNFKRGENRKATSRVCGWWPVKDKTKDPVCQASFSAYALALLIRMAGRIDMSMHRTGKKIALAAGMHISLIAL
jgi:hypothetical protein